MHLGRAVVTAMASIAVRQLGQIIPETFCTPECPQCKGSVTNPFDEALLCQANSSFVVNCGSCQTCIWTYAIENPDLPNMGGLELAVGHLLALCLNTTANDEVVALQSQVSRISELGNVLTSGHIPTTTYSETTFTVDGSSATYTITALASPIPTTLISTVSWLSSYAAEQSSASSASAVSATSANPVSIADASTITAAPVAPTDVLPAKENVQPMSKSWIIGPVIGSILGVATVLIVVYFARRQLFPRAQREIEALKDVKEEDYVADDSGESTRAISKSQSDHFEMGELEDTEVHEMPVPDPVGSELSTPRDGTMDPMADWPLPITPLRAIFAMTEIRDERAGNNNSPQHDTYYNP